MSATSSSMAGGNGEALTVASAGEKTVGTHTFVLNTGADNALMCILVPSK